MRERARRRERELFRLAAEAKRRDVAEAREKAAMSRERIETAAILIEDSVAPVEGEIALGADGRDFVC